MGIELQFENVEALKAMLADCNELSMKSLESVQGGDFGHGRCLFDDQRIAMSWISSGESVGSVGIGSACRILREVVEAC